MRLFVVAATVLAIAAVLIFRPPSFPYRVGEPLLHDYRSRVAFDLLDEYSITSEQRDSDESPPRYDHYPQGILLAKQGQPLSLAKHFLLSTEQRAYEQSLSWSKKTASGLSTLLILTLLASLLVVYVSRYQHQLTVQLFPVVSICSLIFITITISVHLSNSVYDAEIIPLTLTAMILAFVFNAPFAMLMSFTMGIVMCLAEGFRLGPLLINCGGMATSILLLKGIRTRTRPVIVGIWAGLACLSMTVAVGVLREHSIQLILMDSLRHLIWSILAGFILTGILPLVEKAFGIISDTTLMELADGSHPLLQELVRRAPGTHTHSVTVATIAEAAAEEIGAHALLVRVASYYHDIGKMMKPDYFIENQTGVNRHDQLEPALSTLVIIGHIKDGVALAKDYGLPQAIIDMIQQHHGTTLVEYFYREAMRIQEEQGHGCNEMEYAFRYPGPKPQTREAGILMLCDSCESASRALTSPTPNTLRKLVHEMLMKRLLDGQFDESGLSLSELRSIEQSLTKSLTAVYHARIRYQPEEEKKVS